MGKPITNLKELENFLNEQKVFETLGVDQIGVFGSFARGEEFHDIDLLIPSSAKNSNEAYEIPSKLENLSGTKFDFMLEDIANPVVLYTANKDMHYVKKYY